jgi:2-dehydro-3-deoxygluconokinase
MQKRYDVLTVGETMIRLSPPRWQRLEQADTFEVAVGGAESNVAVCLSRFGLRAAWVSRLVDNPLGHRIIQTLRAQGVDVSHVIWTPAGRVGTYFVEFGQPPRSTNIIYDRRGSVMSEMTLSDLDLTLLNDTRLVHLTGITPALSPACRDLVEGILKMAAERGVLRSFDVNYRARLWSADEARQALEPLCAGVDVLFVTRQDAYRLFNCAAGAEETLRWLQAKFNVGVAVLTMGEEGAMALHRDGSFYRARTEPVPEIDPLGSGDAFAAGFLYGYLTDGDLEAALQIGVSAAALKRTIPGDLALITLEESLPGNAHTSGQIMR